MRLTDDLPRIPRLTDWKTLTAAAGFFPRSLIDYAQGAWHSLPRTDWTTWETPVIGGELTRRPAFGDYTVRDSGAPASFGDPVVNVRYTAARQWLVRVGGKHKAGAAPQIKGICRDLIDRPEYSGQAFSAGDGEIYTTAQPATPHGGPTQWIQWAVSHHLVFVTQQIQSHPGL